jgi:ribosomal-protein-alanine acetyltransferase
LTVTDRDVRAARRADIAALAALESLFPGDRLSRASFRHLLTRGHAGVWVRTERDRVVGNAVVLYRHGSRRARLYSLVTHPDCRGRGIGAQLLARAERAARERGCERMTLEVRPDNTAALALYRRCGYAETGRRRGFYEDGSDALCLERPLSASGNASGKSRKPRPAAERAARPTA